MKLPKTLYFEDCLKLTSIMFESNPSVYLVIDDQVFYNQKELLLYLKEYKRKYLTLSAINTREFIFSIGDTVMIVENRYIGVIGDIIGDKIFLYDLTGKSDTYPPFQYIRDSNELVKIDPSLLPLLQD